MNRIIPIIFLLFWATTVSGTDYVIYNKEHRESFAPIRYYFNGAFDVTQQVGFFHQNRFLQRHEIVVKRIRDPFASIKKDGGYGKFFGDEFLGKRAPNIALHTIGSGYDFRYLYEWYQDGKYPAPFLWATLTCYAAHLGNEAIETSNRNISSHDHIADLFFYDVAAIILFSNEQIASFFHNDLQMRAHHFQPYIDVKSAHIVNAGLNYLFRPTFFGKEIRPFAYIGMQNLLGLSFFQPDRILSAGGGMAITDPLKNKGRAVIGLFYENEDQLISSLFINGSEDFRVRLNLYPPLFGKKIQIGNLFALDRQDHLAVGINLNMPIGVGI